MKAKTSKAAAPIATPDPKYPVRAMIRAGTSHAMALQGKVFWWRPHYRVPGPMSAPYLSGPYFKSAPMLTIPTDEAKPWEQPAWPADLVIDPTEQQIADEQTKVAEVRRQAQEFFR